MTFDDTPGPVWTCPFCPLLCDDRRAAAPACPRAESALQALQAVAAAAPAAPRLGRSEISAERARETAATWFAQARQPLIAGWGGDLAAARALHRLAARSGAIGDVGEAAGDAQAQALRAQQDRGGYTATLAELRERAELIVLVGSWAPARAPRLFERVMPGRLAPAPRVVLLGGPADAPAEVALEGGGALAVEALAPGGDPALLAAQLLMLHAGRPAEALGTLPAGLAELARALGASAYSALVWEPAELGPQAALVIERLMQLVGRLNLRTRAAGFPLGGGGGAGTAQQVHTWLSGLPLRTGFGPRGPQHDSLRHAATRLLEQGAVDLLLWVGAFPGQRPPALPAPGTGRAPRRRILLAAADVFAELAAGPDVGPESLLVPVATPGVQHAGHLFRTDGVVLLPLHPAGLAAPALPAVGDWVEALLGTLDLAEAAGAQA